MATPSGLGPTITPAGITGGNFAQWLAYLTAQYQGIFGADVYLGNDSQDGQLLAVFAQACADCTAAGIAIYNSFSPATAQGAGLSSNVKINGLERLTPTYSTVTLTIVGQANTPISNGLASDPFGNTWAIGLWDYVNNVFVPTVVTIPASGSITVNATCTELGAINAAVGTITTIATPTYGWQTVTNPSTAIPGAPVETDAALRLRQSQSVALPSLTVFEGIVANIEQVPGVTRVRGIENATNAVDQYGTPAGTLSFIVEGGTPAAIWLAMAAKITPGIPTFGGGPYNYNTTLVDANGSTRVLNFQTPIESTVNLNVSIKALNGWSSTTETMIANALSAYLDSLPIGANISYTSLIPPAYLIGTPYQGTFNIISIGISVNGSAYQSSDFQLAYNAAAICNPTANVSFTVS